MFICVCVSMCMRQGEGKNMSVRVCVCVLVQGSQKRPGVQWIPVGRGKDSSSARLQLSPNGNRAERADHTARTLRHLALNFHTAGLAILPTC